MDWNELDKICITVHFETNILIKTKWNNIQTESFKAVILYMQMQNLKALALIDQKPWNLNHKSQINP
jgi:hypothetical protein